MRFEVLAPAAALALASCVALFCDVLGKARARLVGAAISVAGIAGCAALLAGQLGRRLPAFGGDWISDPISQTAAVALLSVALVLVVASLASKTVAGSETAYFPLLLMAVLGAIVMASSGDLIVLYLGFEITALPLYALVAFGRRGEFGTEGVMKYFIQGLMSTLVTLYGMSFLLGLTGSSKLAVIASQAATFAGPRATLFVLALVLMSVGFLFKLAAAPFHFWAPDVYQGAPALVTAAIVFVPKVGALVALLRLYPITLGPAQANWQLLFAVVAVVSMFAGNLIALVQTNVKRMLAYSSVAHAGYMMIGVAVGTHRAITATIVYMLAYGVAATGAFLVLAGDGSETLDEIAGLGRRDAFRAVALAGFALSLIGLPPFGGFIGKLLLFDAAVKGGLVWLAVIGVLNSVISVGYYFVVLKAVFFPRFAEGRPRSEDLPSAVSVGACLAGVLALYVAFGPVVDFLGRQFT
jgi:proton-translocating NADH-quinone oxidoreductase chain N